MEGTVIVTGANGGLGSAFVKQFINGSYPYYGVYTVRIRSPQSSGALESILASTQKPHQVMTLDLSSLSAVRAFAAEINEQVAAGKIPKIRTVVLNAAVQLVKGVTFTTDGIETTFAVNYLANFLLVLLLLKSMDTEKGRVVMVSSFTHDPEYYMNSYFAKEKLVFKNPEIMAKPVEEDKKGDEWGTGMRRYARSKLLLLMFMYELQRRLSTDPKLQTVSVLALDPGGMPGTGIVKDSPWFQRFFLGIVKRLLVVINFVAPSLPFRSPNRSAADLLHACFDEKELGQHPKGVNLNGRVKQTTSAESRDEAKQKELWDASLKLAGLREGDTILVNWQ